MDGWTGHLEIKNISINSFSKNKKKIQSTFAALRDDYLKYFLLPVIPKIFISLVQSVAHFSESLSQAHDFFRSNLGIQSFVRFIVNN